MFIDYNLYGMNMLNVAAVKFRRKAQDGESLPIVIVSAFKEQDNHRLRGWNSCLNLLMSLQLYSDCDLDSVVFGHYSLRITWYYIIFHMMCSSLQRMLIPRMTGTGQPPTRPPPLLLMDRSRIGSTTPPCPSPPTSGMRTPSQGNQSQPILRAKNNHHTEVFKSLCEVI